ncbi:hypothetical protein [Nocardia yamanashiensis]|nr:hypothetical protein [Nocardia yamanashiensis]
MTRPLLALLFGTAIVFTALHSLAEGSAIPKLTCGTSVMKSDGAPR